MRLQEARRNGSEMNGNEVITELKAAGNCTGNPISPFDGISPLITGLFSCYV
jgi:hypothetical protein